MTPAQVSSVCRWGARKPACHIALVKAGFLDKLPGGGFAAHQWSDHNAQLFQKWRAGEKGGRPPKEENPNESCHSEKPDDNRPVSAGCPDKTDKTRSDEIGLAGQDLKRLNDERARARETEASGAAANRSSLTRAQERALLERLAAFVGEDEMARAGGHWVTNWIRKHPALLERALADLECQVREGREATSTRGAWLTDLLNRWQE
jgi:hypothetical protein